MVIQAFILPISSRTQTTRKSRGFPKTFRWWTPSRCDRVCLRSRHFVTWPPYGYPQITGASANAKRLECGRFSAAFRAPTKLFWN